MSYHALILSVLEPGRRTLREVIHETGLPPRTVSSILWKLREEGSARLLEGNPNHYEYVQSRPKRTKTFSHNRHWTTFHKKRRLWVRIFERYGNLYTEQATQRLQDRIEWAMIEEFGYIEEPLRAESVEVDACLSGYRWCRPHVAEEPKPWQRTVHQLALDEARIRAAHRLDRRIAEARCRGGWVQLYREAVGSGMDPEIVLRRMGVAAVRDLTDLDRSHGFVLMHRNGVTQPNDLPPLARAEAHMLLGPLTARRKAQWCKEPETMTLKIVYAQTPFPTSVERTLFLAGPTDRGNRPTAWRQEALQILRDQDFDGHVFIPEAEGGKWNGDKDAQFKWEDAALSRADAIVFWVDRDLKTLPGFTTNIEFGLYAASKKIVWGGPYDGLKNDFPERYADKFKVPIVHDLKRALWLANTYIGPGALREGADVLIPIREWREKQEAPIVYPKPDLTADNVVVHGDSLLLIRRRKDPYGGSWALPGGYVNKGEKSKDAAVRELQEEAGLTVTNPRLIGVFDAPDRDPRGWVVSHAYFSHANTRDIQAGDDAVEAAWFSFDEVDTMTLAFDHNAIIREVIDAGMI